MREARVADVEKLAEICKGSFPQTFRWQVGGRLAEEWLHVAIDSQAVEMWVVAEDKNSIAAFCVLVTDEAQWAKEKQLRKGSSMACVYCMLMHPWAAFLHARQYLKRQVGWRADSHWRKQMPKKWGPEVRTWIEVVAVKPDRRGLGLASRLLEQCRVRTEVLGRQAIALRVGSNNSAA